MQIKKLLSSRNDDSDTRPTLITNVQDAISRCLSPDYKFSKLLCSETPNFYGVPRWREEIGSVHVFVPVLEFLTGYQEVINSNHKILDYAQNIPQVVMDSFLASMSPDFSLEDQKAQCTLIRFIFGLEDHAALTFAYEGDDAGMKDFFIREVLKVYAPPRPDEGMRAWVKEDINFMLRHGPEYDRNFHGTYYSEVQAFHPEVFPTSHAFDKPRFEELRRLITVLMDHPKVTNLQYTPGIWCVITAFYSR